MAIAFDSVSDSNATSTSLTYAHTTSGDNRILFVSVLLAGEHSDYLTGVTYGGVAMTQVGKVINANTGSTYLYVLFNPAVGANNIVVNSSASVAIYSQAESFTGARQSVLDGSNTSAVTNVTSITLSIITTADNCWCISCPGAKNQAPTASTGITTRGQATPRIGDSNSAKTPAGSYSMTWVDGVTDNINMVMASFAPFIESGPSNLKSLNTNLKANIKTINGNPIANVKSLNTNV